MDTSSAKTPATPMLAGLAAIAERYDGFILDLWGTIHDGLQPLAGAVECLDALKARDKKILILSNAPRRSAAVEARMDRIGIPRGLYDHVLSSGEAAYIAIKERPADGHQALGRACYFIGAEDDDSVVAGLDLKIVGEIGAADFIAVIGVGREESVADYEDLLREGAGRGLPLVCANPDLVVLRGAAREVCAGALAARYETLGGPVLYHGKPHAPIYARAFDILGIAERRRILAVGDSLRTDVAGAKAAGIDSLFITSGIHAEALGTVPFETPDAARLAALYAEAGQHPGAASPAFIW
ncbi:MAG: TIGR01459 family HAD-type hydrolase [Alphaproteobacteria bacterium]